MPHREAPDDTNPLSGTFNEPGYPPAHSLPSASSLRSPSPSPLLDPSPVVPPPLASPPGPNQPAPDLDPTYPAPPALPAAPTHSFVARSDFSAGIGELRQFLQDEIIAAVRSIAIL
ncbi:hypothetical protein NDA18_001106 [Ustilago nuda]|nr:hypothetical protein NDA18_001106 [Ustilago nuda]